MKKLTNEKRELIWQLYQEGEQVKDIAKSVGVAISTAWAYSRGRERGFTSKTDYQNRRVSERGFPSNTAYQDYLSREKGFPSFTAYREHLVEVRGFRSYGDYLKNIAEKRRKRPANKALSRLIINRLKREKKNSSWLAEQLGVTRQSVDLYKRGKSIPKKATLEKLFSVLELPYRSIDDLLE